MKDIDSLTHMSTINAQGTLAFVTDEQALLVRVSKGWQYVSLGSLVETKEAEKNSVSISETSKLFERSKF